MSEFNLAIFLKTLPQSSGVYRMIAADDTVLYVGKAVNLKRRVSSYFQKNDHSPRIQLMLKQVARVEITLTRSEAEALILENNLIKSLSPKYNILFRDDKSYPYLMLSGHDFPRLAYFRGTPKKPHQFFGPYPNGYAVRDSIEILQKVFQLRTCEDSVFAHRDRACLLHQIKRCSAPCVGAIDGADYAQSVQAATDFLNGKTADLLKTWEQNMLQAAENLDFEQAAKWRDQIQALSVVQAKQFIDSHTSNNQQNIDIIVICVEQGQVCVHWASVRGGRHVGDKNFFPDTRNDPNPQIDDYAQAFVAQHYLGKNKPDVLIVNFRLPESLHTALNAEHGKKIAIVQPERGERKVWLDMAIRNAQQALSQFALQNVNQKQRIMALAEIMGLPENELHRLECFDISHTQGEATVASCVVYDDFAMQPKQYRRYNIATAKAGDDYAAMREVLTRRYGKMVQAAAQGENVKFPDVVLIDGGKGQVNMALEVWAELGLTMPIVGIAKGVERKAGLEELILPFGLPSPTGRGGEVFGAFDEFANDLIPSPCGRGLGRGQDWAMFRLPENSPALHLLQTIRDESHRFAITGHRAKRDKARITSSLNDIAGVGAKRKAALLMRFGGLRGVQAASVDDLASVDGISPTLAQTIYDYFHGG